MLKRRRYLVRLMSRSKLTNDQPVVRIASDRLRAGIPAKNRRLTHFVHPLGRIVKHFRLLFQDLASFPGLLYLVEGGVMPPATIGAG